MRSRNSVLGFFLVTLLVIVPAVSTQAQQRAAAPRAEGEERPIPDEQMSVTEHSITLDGATIPYEATAATMHLVNDDGDAIGSLYYTAYRRTDVDSETRPLAFIFNGGPGSASV